jgi:hypothetical protein
VLKNLDVDLRRIRQEVEKIVRSGPNQVLPGKLPQTPRAKRAIEFAVYEARMLKCNCVGTEHVLLGLLREDEGVAVQVLMNLGLKLDDVRQEVLRVLGGQASVCLRYLPVWEFDIYLPLARLDGTVVEPHDIERLIQRFHDACGSPAVFCAQKEGIWRTRGEVAEGVILLRILTSKESRPKGFLRQLKREFQQQFGEERVMIVQRSGEVL